MAKPVGLSRSLKLEWLNKTVELIIENNNEEQIKSELDYYLSFEIKDLTNLMKTRNILIKSWIKNTTENGELRRIALKAYNNECSNKLALHWCMLLTSYPIFADVSSLIGKITNIQDTFTTAWIREKIFEQWGESATLLHSVPKILQTLKQMDIIENEKNGVYHIKKHKISDFKASRIWSY